MAPVLVCPECSTKHPLGDIGDRTAFPCSGCGRQLKVPAAAGVASPGEPTPPSTPAAPRPLPPEPRTRAVPVAPPPIVVTPPDAAPPAAPAKSVRNPIPPAWLRFLIWIVAVPLAFLVVFGFARATGTLTTNELSDVVLTEGLSRFWPIVRLIPFVAIVAAAFVQGGAFGIARLRERRWAEQASGSPTTNGSSPRNPPKSRGPQRPIGSQSSRTRA